MNPKELAHAYARGENITALLKGLSKADYNTEDVIETAYDLQAGSYIASLDDPIMYQHKSDYGRSIANEILSLTLPTTILEAGVGEGTTFSFVLTQLNNPDLMAHGFDISWSRIAHCQKWLQKNGHRSTFLSVASLLNLPYLDNSFDVVYTSHTIEPNGGNEKAILQELYRVTSQYLVLLEPGYELASEKAQQRMEEHGYCKALVQCAEDLGMRVLKHELFPHAANPLNPTAITIVVKDSTATAAIPKLACPRFGDPLIDSSDSLFSPESLRAYPKIQGIPCLRSQDGIIASAYIQED
jgi:SAM-dependent methyltransferase